MRLARFYRRSTGTARLGRPTDAPCGRRWRLRGGLGAVLAAAALALQWALAGLVPALAATPLNVFVGYMDTHSAASSSKQPKPWPYTDPTSYVGSPCPSYPTSTTCWDAAALRLDNPGSVDVTGVHVVVAIGSKTYNLWGASMTVKAGGTLVLTETGAQNSTNFDGSDFSPNSYNGGNTASCVNSGAVPDVRVTVGTTTTSYLDSGQVLNGAGVDSGHCVNGTFVSGRIDESHPWAQIGVAASNTPSAPQSLAAVAGDASVNLSWRAPASDGGSAVTGYNVYRGTTPGGEGTSPVATNVSTTTFTDAGRVNGTTYYYTVSAVNAVGVSARSNEASATPQTTQPTAPGAPTGLSATAGNASVALAWTAPASNGGSALTGYAVYRGSTPGGESPTPIATNVTGTRFTDTGEVNGTAYYYKVAATNAVGTSPQSNEASATPRATAPSAPGGLIASAGDRTVALSWQMPTSDGGSGITGYNVYRGTSAGAEGSAPIASNVAITTFTDSGLVDGTTYFYRVAAVNAVGASALSGEASATPQAAATVPSAPQSLAAVGSNTTVALTWSRPASDGGSAVTGYSVYRGTSAGAEAATPIAANVAGTSFTDTGLVNGTTYFYRVAAVNAVGTSTPSIEASARPQATLPTAPTGLVASGGNTTVGLAWSAPASDGGSAVTGYAVYRGTSAGGEAATPVAANVAATSFTDTGLVNGTTYFYRVAAVNGVGTSAPSTEVSATPQAPVAAGYVGRIGSLTASTARTTSTVTVGPAGVQAGHTVVVSVLLSTTSLTAAVSVKDTVGNAYVVGRDGNDGSAGDRVVTAVAVGVRAMPAGATVTVTYGSAAETHLAVDELAGVTSVDGSAFATGTGATFSSGSATTTAPNDVLFGVAGLESSGTAPAWATGWTALPRLSLSTDHLATAYRVASTSGPYAASGSGGGQWMATLVALRTS
ncbi:fibronectin type III domain-containing protein [Terrabacter sp. 2RAF25]|uniref:fibronectin type III domain-containing protein n=1 Tax=Terrabacter sp. 2RAF25 TaxID=3232998 RepID=UPI003F98837A